MLEFIIKISVSVVSFLIGRYLLPKIHLTKLSRLAAVAYRLVADAAYVLSDASGEEKKRVVTSELTDLCRKEGISTKKNTISDIIEQAYIAMREGRDD